MHEKFCAWCLRFGKKRKAKEGFALCEQCYEMQEADEKRWLKTGKQAHFICPNCKKDIGNRIICPYCGTMRYRLMSLPFHCSVCDCQFFYFKNNDTNTQPLCWCCNSPFKPSSIDNYIMYALRHFEEYLKETKNEQNSTVAVGSKSE